MAALKSKMASAQKMSDQEMKISHETQQFKKHLKWYNWMKYIILILVILNQPYLIIKELILIGKENGGGGEGT